MTPSPAPPGVKPYRPYSGSEGADFMARFCDRCARDAKYRETDDGADACPIATWVMCLSVDHPDYPKEWIVDERGPRCTAFEVEAR